MFKPKQSLLVCGPQVNMALARYLFPDWFHCRVGEALTGHRFDVIVVLIGQVAAEEKAKLQIWYEEQLLLKLAPGAKIEILG